MSEELGVPRVEAAPFVGRRVRRWPRLAIIASVVALLAGLVVFVGRRGSSGKALPERDVPTAEGRSIVLSERYRERIGLATVMVREAPLAPVVKVAGTVAFDPEYVGAAGTRLKGFVRKVVRFEGDAVKQGELLAEIDSPELAQAQASVTTLKAQRDAAELNAKRERELAERGLTTSREVEVAEATLREANAKLAASRQGVNALGGGAAALGLHELRAPITGSVVERHLNAGQSVEANLVAFRVANLDHLWIEMAVFERNIASIKRGDSVLLSPLATPDVAITGQVAHIGETVDPDTRTVAVRVEVDNKERLLRPGQAVTAQIQASGARRAAALLVPKSAVIFVDGKPTVFVAETPLRLVATNVELGESDGDLQQVVSGLGPGQSVASTGVFALKSELFR